MSFIRHLAARLRGDYFIFYSSLDQVQMALIGAQGLSGVKGSFILLVC
jgi:hypothetical protein